MNGNISCSPLLLGRLDGAQHRVVLGKDPVLGCILLVTGIAGGGGLRLGAGQSFAAIPHKAEICPVARLFGEAFGILDRSRNPYKLSGKEPGNWAYISFMGDGGKALASAKAQTTAACNTCHQQNAAEDWVFTQHYPVLRAVKPAK